MPARTSTAGSKRREGRGHLSAIDLLPEEAEGDIAWARDRLRERHLPQKVILEEFNHRLADKGLGPISSSSWNRYAVRRAILWRDLDAKHRLASELVKTIGGEGSDNMTLLAGELIKLKIFDLLENADLGPKGLQELGRALSSAEMAQVKAKLKKAADAVEKVGRKTGAPRETMDKITQLLTTGAF